MFLYISFRIQTYLGTNGPTGADVPLSIKQTNKQSPPPPSCYGSAAPAEFDGLIINVNYR